MVDRSSEIAGRQAAAIADALGPLVNGLLSEPDVTDVMLNPPLTGEKDGRIWVGRLGHPREPVGFMSAEQAHRLIGAVASTMNKAVTADAPQIEGFLITDRSRFTGVIPPVSPPWFAIRRHASRVFTLRNYVERGQMTERQLEVIEAAVLRRLNILVVGSTGAGKTTLLNAIIAAMAELTPTHRFFGIEEVPELQCKAADQVFTLTTATVTIRDLIRTAMRSFPDRILIGEARGAEMLEILMAWRTGHEGGCATIHSGVTTPEGALERVEDMVSLATIAPMQRMIAKTIGLIVCVELDEQGRRHIRQIVSVHGYDRDTQTYLTKQEN